MKLSTLPGRQVIVGLTALTMSAISMGAESPLDQIHRDIVADYTDVKHIDADSFTALPTTRRIVFDVRGADEYRVSHIEGAIRVDPDIDSAAFIRRYAALLDARVVVFYCSVGRRSSILAQRLQGALAANGASASYNLVGGLFQWHNQHRPLVNDDGETDAVHPYNAFWGRLIIDQETVRYR